MASIRQPSALQTTVRQPLVTLAQSRPSDDPNSGTRAAARDAESMREKIRRRWRSDRPFEGVATVSLLRKLKLNVLRASVKSLAADELLHRDLKVARLRLELFG